MRRLLAGSQVYIGSEVLNKHSKTAYYDKVLMGTIYLSLKQKRLFRLFQSKNSLIFLKFNSGTKFDITD